MSGGRRAALRPLVRRFVETEVYSVTEEYYRVAPRRPRAMGLRRGSTRAPTDGLKAKAARDAGLWNFFLPNAEDGVGTRELDYAYIASELGKNRDRL